MVEDTKLKTNHYLSSRQFANAIGHHIQTVRYWDKTGQLKPHHRTPGGKRMYSEEQVADFIKNEKQHTSSRPE